MYSLITDIEKIDEKQHVEVAVESDSLEGALVRYLNELIFQFDTYGFIGRRIEIVASELITPNPQLKIIVYGEEFDAEKHDRKLLVKAATYHNIKAQKTDDTWEIEVIFDI
jgi:SHS2 domain-containing protein